MIYKLDDSSGGRVAVRRFNSTIAEIPRTPRIFHHHFMRETSHKIVFFISSGQTTSLSSAMPIHTPVTITGIYFITFTCQRWLSLIETVKGYDLIYNWFDILTEKGHSITGYVIMPNHLHLLLHYVHTGRSLNTIVGNGKRFMAYDIVHRLEAANQIHLLNQLESDVCATGRMRGKKHEAWKDSFDVKHCRTEKFLLQKLNYIHNNPCTGKWNLAASPIEYPHSSALFYITGKTGVYPVTDYLQLLNSEKFDFDW